MMVSRTLPVGAEPPLREALFLLDTLLSELQGCDESALVGMDVFCRLRQAALLLFTACFDKILWPSVHGGCQSCLAMAISSLYEATNMLPHAALPVEIAMALAALPMPPVPAPSADPRAWEAEYLLDAAA